MTLEELQKKIDKILRQYEKPYWEPLSMLARLAEETGEVARVLNSMYGDKPKKPEEKHDLEGELGDLLWTIICIANREKINLENTIDPLIEKLTIRDVQRFKKLNP